MEPIKYRKSFDIVPRVFDERVEGGGGENRRGGKKRVGCRGTAYDTAPVFGRWTAGMMSALRRMWGAAQDVDDDQLCDRIADALAYLYTRKGKAKRRKK